MITDLLGNTRRCDPVLFELISTEETGAFEVVRNLPAADGWVTIYNSSPGLRNLSLFVNNPGAIHFNDLAGAYHFNHLKDNEARTIQVFADLRPGDDNLMVFRSSDRLNGSAEVFISDVRPILSSIPDGSDGSSGPDGSDGPDDAPVPFLRGDVNADGVFDIADPMGVVFYLMEGASEPTCMKSADFDDSGWVDLTDAVNGLHYLFVPGSPEPSSPSRRCGLDPTPDFLGCDVYPGCN